LIFTVAFVLALSGSVTSPSWTTATEFLGNTTVLTGGLMFCGQNIVSSAQSGYTDTAHWTDGFTIQQATIIAAFKATAPTGVGPFVGHIGHA
jgi:hypothetical protein